MSSDEMPLWSNRLPGSTTADCVRTCSYRRLLRLISRLEEHHEASRRLVRHVLLVALIRGFCVVVLDHPLERLGRLVHERPDAERVVLEQRQIGATDLVEVRAGRHAL